MTPTRLRSSSSLRTSLLSAAISGTTLDRGEFITVVEGYEDYLNAYLIQYVRVSLGDTSVDLPVLVDGRPRDYEILIAAAVSASDVLTVATGGFALAVERVEVLPAVRVGVVNRGDAAPVDLSGARLHQVELVEPGTYRPLGAGSTVQLPLPSEQDSIGRVRVRIALFKPVDRELWAFVSRSYGNLLDDAGRLTAARRTLVLESAAAADLVMERLVWAQEGVLRSDEFEN